MDDAATEQDRQSQLDRVQPLAGGGKTALIPVTSEVLRVEAAPVETAPLTWRNRRRWGLLLLLILTAGVAVYWQWGSSGGSALSYKTALIDRGSIVATVTATGSVNPVTSVLVGSQVSGKIKTLYADYNSEVKQGQKIAQIDPAPFEARAAQARAAVKSAFGTLAKSRTALAQRKLELDRAASLRRQQFIPQADLDLARTNYRDALAQIRVAQAQVEQAQAAYAVADLDLSLTTIYSPVDGTVISRNVDVGQTVAATLQTPTLFVIAQDLTKMQVNASVSEADIGGLADGHQAEFTVDAYSNETFTGTVVQVRNAPINVQNVITYDVIIEVENRALKLKPGMTANVSIVRAQKDKVLRVPNAALRFRIPNAPIEPKRPIVWSLDAQGRPQARSLMPGITDGNVTEVAGGDLREGDRVIVGMGSEDETDRKTLPPGFGVGPRMR
jgi:HlyD family secretion protein